jgi:hexosaminidase
MKKLTFALLLVSISISLLAQSPAIMPLPSEMKPTGGRFKLDDGFRISVKADPKDDILYAALTRAYQSLNRRTGLFFHQQQITAADNRNDANLQVTVSKKAEPAVGADESYAMTITENGISLIAMNTLGALHGLETLQQLLQWDSSGYFFPTMEIQDSPRFPWRGMMVDVARHFLPMDVMLRNIDAMAAVKLNVLHLHLSDDEGFRVESKTYPLLQEKGSNGEYFTQAQIKELIAYARARGILVYPEFDLPGHCRSWFAGYPELASAPGPYVPGPRFEIDPNSNKPLSIASILASPTPTIDPTRESTYKFLDGLFKEMAALFPAPYFHIGADENNGVAWKNNKDIMAWMEKQKIANTTALQAYFVSRCYAIVKKYGKTMVGWEELNSPELAKDVVVQKWLADGGFMKGHGTPAEIAAKGNKVLVSTTFYLDHFMPAYIHYTNPNLPSDANPNYLGGEAAIWTEVVDRYNAETRIWPRAAAIAERLWSPASVKDVDDMYRRLWKTNRYLDEKGLQQVNQYETALRNLSRNEPLSQVRPVVEVLTPLRGVKKLMGKMTQSAVHSLPSSPNQQVSDILPVESETRYRFRKDVANYLTTRDPATEARIRRQLSDWTAAARSYGTLGTGNARLAEVASHASDLEQLGTLGLAALDRLKAGTPYRAEDAKADQALIDKARKNLSGEVELSVIPEIESLLKQQLVPEPKTISMF